jgi:hypothetical protein
MTVESAASVSGKARIPNRRAALLRLERMRDVRRLMRVPPPGPDWQCARCAAFGAHGGRLPPDWQEETDSTGRWMNCDVCLAETCLAFPSEVDLLIHEFEAQLLKTWQPIERPC